MKIFALPVLLLLIFASCNQCKNTNCLNGGTCSDGKCQCINPYTGKNCETNICDSVICHHGGNCVNGSCACTSGYEGVHCDSLVTSKFTGSFSCSRVCASSLSQASTVIVTASGPISASNITFTSLSGFQPVAVVTGYAINIQSQVMQTGETLSGSGRLSTDRQTISLTMVVIPAGASTGNSCDYTLTRN